MSVYRIAVFHEGLLGTEVSFVDTKAQADQMVEECLVACESDGGMCQPPVVEQGEFVGFNFVPTK